MHPSVRRTSPRQNDPADRRHRLSRQSRRRAPASLRAGHRAHLSPDPAQSDRERRAAARGSRPRCCDPARSTRWRATHGDSWPGFVRDKIVPIAGDVSQPRLGLGDDDFTRSRPRSVDIVINSAASVVFDAPLDEAFLHNTRSVQHVAEFARACRSAVLVHVSTAYVAGRRSGRIAEAALAGRRGRGNRRDRRARRAAILDDGERGNADARATRSRLVEAGMTRARRLGWHDTYTYTKALGEMVLARASRRRADGDHPADDHREQPARSRCPAGSRTSTSAIRCSSSTDADGCRTFRSASTTIYDIVPVDLVANALLARAAARRRHAGRSATTRSGPARSTRSPARQLYDIAYDYFTRHPMHDRHGRADSARRIGRFPTPRALPRDVRRRAAQQRHHEAVDVPGGSLYETT